MTECIEWQGALRRGYAHRTVDGRATYVHRTVCAEAHGPAPAGKPLALHHCDNRKCLNPDHLYWGDHADNMRDMAERGRARNGHAGKTHCIHGHPFDEENTYVHPRGFRQCKTCRRRIDRRRRGAPVKGGDPR